MTGTDWAAILGAVALLMAPIGAGFGWLINMIVKQSKEAVTELKRSNEKTLSKMEKERDMWRDRAFAAGWKEGSK